jgi:biotin carboxylase
MASVGRSEGGAGVVHLLLAGAWPELANQLVGLPATVTLLELKGMPGGSELVREARWAHRHVVAQWNSRAAVITEAETVHAEDPVTVVAGFGEFTLPAVSWTARALRVPSVPGPADSLGSDKAAVRTVLNRGGCRPVRFQVCDTVADAAEFADRHGLPVVLKPAAGNGSLGVHAVENPDTLQTAWDHATASGLGAVLAEEMLVGPEYSVETRSVDGAHEVVAVTEKSTTGSPHFVETGHLVPARLNPTAGAAIGAEAIRALDAIHHQLGPCHVEVIVSRNGPAVVEINRRLGGDRIWELVQLATGRNLMRDSLLDATGIAHQPVGATGGAACIRFLTGTDVGFDPPVASAPGLVRLRWEPTTYHHRLGYVITRTEHPDDAVRSADDLVRRVMVS